MFNQPAKLAYSGLTVLMDNPSRFDIKNGKLLSGLAGEFFSYNLKPLHLLNVDVQDVVNDSPRLRSETKVVLVLGEVLAKSLSGSTRNIHTLRGIPFVREGVTYIPTYLPQETFDPVPLEARHNPIAKSIFEESGSDDDTDGKGAGVTSRPTWRFWLQKDTQKAVRLLTEHKGVLPLSSPTYILTPGLPELDAYLRAYDGPVYFDIETDCERNILCFGIGTTTKTFVVPFLRWDYKLAYANWHIFFRTLGKVFRDNEVVIHNSMFDLAVLALKYQIAPPRRVYDTMFAQSRIYPEAAKSLGHCISLWTWEAHHKNEGVFMPQNSDQEMQLWKYNAKDVWTMKLIHDAQVDYCKSDPGLVASVAQVNSSIRPYLFSSLVGIRYDESKRAAKLAQIDRRLNQWLRVLHTLVGYPLLPTSPAQLTQYFVDKMGYAAIGYTTKGTPSWGKKELVALRLKEPGNKAIQLIRSFKLLARAAGECKFTPYLT